MGKKTPLGVTFILQVMVPWYLNQNLSLKKELRDFMDESRLPNSDVQEITEKR